MADAQEDDVEMEQEDVSTSTKDRQSREQAAALNRMTDSQPVGVGGGARGERGAQ